MRNLILKDMKKYTKVQEISNKMFWSYREGGRTVGSGVVKEILD